MYKINDSRLFDLEKDTMTNSMITGQSSSMLIKLLFVSKSLSAVLTMLTYLDALK
jgi:hypothetical protein